MRSKIASRRGLAVGMAGVLVGAIVPVALLTSPPAAAADPCTPPVVNLVACENTQTGAPDTEWELANGPDDTIEGFTTEFSVNAGQTVRFKIRTTDTAGNPVSASYSMDIYRMGYYQGKGARFVTSVTPTPRTQPANCITDATTGLIDCGNWQESASWAVPSAAVSGVYFAHIKRTNGDDNHIVFVVRNDSSHADLVVQTSDTTWQAYNEWGGNSLYHGNPVGRAYKVSYNRPFSTRKNTPGGRDFVFSAEYPLIRFLERNGYDATYISGIDTDRAGSLLQNHKVFISSGHDEYWSGQQRANVEAARDAGVNLAFFSGNEVFWKTRWENSTDGTNTPYRTLVTYKETHANAKIDPQPVSTGTWRDPRFGPDGGKPENGLTGVIWTVNCCSYAMKVPAADGKMRFWRNTSVATLSSGTTATLASNTLGYEWDEDLDNGARPRGLFHMSSQTENVDQYAQGFGSTVAPGTATHHLSMYKAPSGALVFGAGTVQWAWGLDDNHDGNDGVTIPADVRMQQATVNLLADMHVQPATLMSGLVAATASSDTTAPTSNLSSPAPNAQLANGSTVTVSGTAADSGGGRVGGVEVSTDGGTTWHPANGRESWTYTWRVGGSGAVTVKTRAVDDSGNVENPGVGTTVNVSCPCSVFGQLAPSGSTSGDTSPLELGMKFRASADGWVTGIRFYKGSGNTGTHTGTLWSASGNKLATATFTNETASGWQSVKFAAPVHVTAGTTYIASYFAPNGNYYGTSNGFFTSGVDSPPLAALRDGVDGPNGVYNNGGPGFPTSSFNATNYWVDVTFDTQAPPDTDKPTVTSSTPLNGSSSVLTSIKPSVTFSEAIQPSSLSFVLKTQAGATVPGSVSYDSTTRIATFTPSSALAAGTPYTATVSGAQDFASPPNVMDTYTFSFTTAQQTSGGQCPCSIWSDATVPTTISVDDPNELELGVKFRTDTDGFINGIRFYKGPNNTGTHIGTLWKSDGTQLATATFSSESTTGWQQVSFPSPVAVTAGTTYVASYHTTAGWYSSTDNGFASAVVNAPLTALANGQDGPNGVYRYGARAFPTQGVGANYYVDVVFTPPNDSTPPSVASTNPSAGATSIPVSSKVSATFTEDVSTAGTFTLKDAANNAVAGTTAYSSANRTVTFTPSASLAAGTTYTATVSGAKDLAGNTMASPHTWSFTTSGSGCPCTIFPSDATPANPAENDTNAVELGVKFTADVDGFITGVRFYKGTGNTGTHLGHLWNTSGGLLKSATFSGESATGWQSVTFSTPVAVTAGTTYIASYYAPNGHYAATSGFFTSGPYDNAPLHALADGTSGGNGVYVYGASGFPDRTFGGTNYWVDPIFTASSASDTVPPAVDSTNPVNGQTSVTTTVNPSVTFEEPVQASTVQLTLTGPGGTAVSGTVSYDAASRTARFAPASPLAFSTTYAAQVSGAQDLAGNTMTASVSWSFTTAAQSASGCPCSVWPETAVPQVPSQTDSSGVALGLKFRADTSGYITGVRFYKGTGNTGTHTGHLWAADGTVLASVTFGGESAAGWQQATFSAPVPVTANTTYVVSYYAPNGHYSVDVHGLANAGVDNPPLHALQNGVDGANGVYRYGSDAFPTSGSDHNYWVDVVYDTSAAALADTTAPTVTATTPADGATGVATTTAPTATFSEDVQASTVQMTLTGPGSTAVSGTVSYDSAARKATFTPGAALAASTTYTVKVSGAKDTAGNAMTTSPTWSFTTAAPPDTTPPTVTATTPANAATGVATNTAPTATFSENVQASTIAFTVTTPTGSNVAGTVAYDSAAREATFTPSAALAGQTTYTARVSGAKDTAGNAMTSTVTWTFTTGCPCTLFPSTATPATLAATSNRPIETGVKLRADRTGTITAIRFYKGSTNTGTHVGHIWSSTGTLLRTVTFTGETASGWQQMTLGSPLTVSANTTYVVSVWMPAGHWAFTTSGLSAAVDRAPLHAPAGTSTAPNGVYRYDSSGFPTSGLDTNYWVDAVFS